MDAASKSSGERGGMTDVMVVIDLAGPNHPNLTLIDLPGIVRTTSDKNTQSDVIEFVHKMLIHYVKQTRTVILAVLSANVDLHNQEILKMAEEADPDGDRTLAVLTKPDIIERGTEGSMRDLMLNCTRPIKLGWAAGHSQFPVCTLN